MTGQHPCLLHPVPGSFPSPDKEVDNGAKGFGDEVEHALVRPLSVARLPWCCRWV